MRSGTGHKIPILTTVPQDGSGLVPMIEVGPDFEDHQMAGAVMSIMRQGVVGLPFD